MSQAFPAASVSARLAADMVLVLLGQGVFTPGRPEFRQAAGALADGLARQLRSVGQVAFLAGSPAAPLAFVGWGIASQGQPLETLLPVDFDAGSIRYLAGSWRDRCLILLSLQSGMTRQEFDLLLQLLAAAGEKGPGLRQRYLEELLRGRLTHVTLLFADEVSRFGDDVPWPVKAALAWLQRDLTILARMTGVPETTLKERRLAVVDAVLEIAGGAEGLRDLLLYLNLIAEEIDGYDRDEIAALLLGRLKPEVLAASCTMLCLAIERLQQRLDRAFDNAARERIEAARWITRRCADLLIEKNGAAPAHYHALVLQKVLLYEEIPGKIRPRVAALQVLTSFLSNPQRYFTEIEGSHSPEVLATRLWRLMEMLPNMLLAGRFDAVRDVIGFAQRFGASFELSQQPELLAQVRETAGEILATGDLAQQAELMKILLPMGPTGLHLLIDLADHPQRPVRRLALDGLTAAGPAVVPVLFEALERKTGWHYLRNALVILGRVGVGGPKVEALFRQGLEHQQPGVRKEALPGVARLLRENAASLVVARLADSDPEVRRRAVACLGLTGIPSPEVYGYLSELLTTKSGNDMALAAVAVLNQLRPGPAAGSRVEAGLVSLAGGGGWFGQGRGVADRTLRLEAVKALGQFPGERARKSLERLLKDEDAGVARAAREALAG